MMIKICAILDFPDNDKVSEDQYFEHIKKCITLKKVEITEGAYKGASGEIGHAIMMWHGLDYSKKGVKIHAYDCRKYQGGKCNCK